MWQILKEKIRCKSSQTLNLNFANEEWYLIPNDMIQKLYGSCRKRHNDTVRVKGGYTKY